MNKIFQRKIRALNRLFLIFSLAKLNRVHERTFADPYPAARLPRRSASPVLHPRGRGAQHHHRRGQPADQAARGLARPAPVPPPAAPARAHRRGQAPARRGRSGLRRGRARHRPPAWRRAQRRGTGAHPALLPRHLAGPASAAPDGALSADRAAGRGRGQHVLAARRRVRPRDRPQRRQLPRLPEHRAAGRGDLPGVLAPPARRSPAAARRRGPTPLPPGAGARPTPSGSAT